MRPPLWSFPTPVGPVRSMVARMQSTQCVTWGGSRPRGGESPTRSRGDWRLLGRAPLREVRRGRGPRLAEREATDAVQPHLTLPAKDGVLLVEPSGYNSTRLAKVKRAFHLLPMQSGTRDGNLSVLSFPRGTPWPSWGVHPLPHGLGKGVFDLGHDILSKRQRLSRDLHLPRGVSGGGCRDPSGGLGKRHGRLPVGERHLPTRIEFRRRLQRRNPWVMVQAIFVADAVELIALVLMLWWIRIRPWIGV